MNSKGSEIFCEACGKHWQLTEYGQLQAVEGETEFPHPPSWYEWERENVRREVEAGTYSLECEVLVDSLPNSDGFVQMGKGWFKHDMDGIVLQGEYLGDKFEIVKTVPSLYSIHIEYNYIDKKMDCIDVSTLALQVAAVSGSYADAATLQFPVYTPATTEAFATCNTVMPAVAPILQRIE